MCFRLKCKFSPIDIDLLNGYGSVLRPIYVAPGVKVSGSNPGQLQIVNRFVAVRNIFALLA